MKVLNQKDNNKTKKRPWHLWIIGLLFLYIYGYGIYDIFMMLGQNKAYYHSKGFDENTLIYFSNYPSGLIILWIINLFSGFTAPILLLFQSKLAVEFSFISAAFIIIQQIVTFGFFNRLEALGTFVSIFDVFIMLLTICLFFYCRKMKTVNILS